MGIHELYDVTIIGGGPGGLFSAFYSGLREMKTKIIEAQNYLGGKVNVYPEKLIWDIGALPPISGEKLIQQMVEQAMTFDPTVVLGEKVTEISKNDEGVFVLKTDQGRTHFSKAVIVAIGGGIITPQKLEVEGASKFYSSNLNYTIKSLKKFKDKVVIVSGGGHTAVDWCNGLEPIAKKVFLSCRKGRLNAHEAQVTQLLNSSVECLFYTEITRLIPNQDGTAIEQVELTNNETGEVTYLTVDEVVVNHGFAREKSLFEHGPLKVDFVNEYYIKGNVHCETNVPGLYAVGDAVDYDGKVHLIAGAYTDAVNAVNRAKLYVQPDAEATGMVSTHNEIFYQRNRELIQKILK
ncbi:NAD(P)/FAD-dependent oxidoreductase [Ureibacillus terrenus]|uniref:Ferredoxin--NADP reductase n=1 Tax=Ureibacillus terrenus TaxID=118246 RepID=A0A540V522_9BACL|nr:NAD(P)/FAD-dependent oxidoreductase [Ureibacillus terrenus]TQE91243.1 NAD(P)/FAD-dependent oxidoreductase [Ureibacillus terrenus]